MIITMSDQVLNGLIQSTTPSKSRNPRHLRNHSLSFFMMVAAQTSRPGFLKRNVRALISTPKLRNLILQGARQFHLPMTTARRPAAVPARRLAAAPAHTARTLDPQRTNTKFESM